MTEVEGPTVHDAGGKTRLPLMDGVTARAYFSGEHDEYRIHLWRECGMGPYALWLGCNPSVAGFDVDDPTVRREQIRTWEMGVHRYLKMNLSPYRATDPKELKKAKVDLFPEDHRDLVYEAAFRAAKIVVAFGQPPKELEAEAREICDTLLWLGFDLWCLGTTKDGWPRHPLYVTTGTGMARWYGPEKAMGETFACFMPDEDCPPQDGCPFEIGMAYAIRAPNARRIRDLVFFQAVEPMREGKFAVDFLPAAHLGVRHKDKVEAWVKRELGEI